jgi:predicted acylesterase/phospholipase RssA
MRATTFLVVLAIALLAVPSAEAGKDGFCRALALSGGGDKAAYEAGVLRGLLANLPAEEVAWDVVTGISAGSTLTAAFSCYDVGQEDDAISFVENIINDLNQSSIFQNWPGGLVDGFLHHSSLFDSTPLRHLFEKVLVGKQLTKTRTTCMGAANLRTGGFERFCSHANFEALINVTIASAAIPGVFLDQTFGGETYVDGGTLVNMDVTGAIENCLALGYTQENIIVDTIACGGVNMTAFSGDPATATVLPVFLRAGAMKSFSNGERDYTEAQYTFPQVNFRYRIQPTQKIPGTGIDFNPTEMAWMQQLGQLDAANAVNPPRIAEL